MIKISSLDEYFLFHKNPFKKKKKENNVKSDEDFSSMFHEKLDKLEEGDENVMLV